MKNEHEQRREPAKNNWILQQATFHNPNYATASKMIADSEPQPNLVIPLQWETLVR